MIEVLLQTLLNGAASGGVYALVALGYTLVFSVLGVINFALGALFSLGGYLTYLLMGGSIGNNGGLPGWGLLWSQRATGPRGCPRGDGPRR